MDACCSPVVNLIRAIRLQARKFIAGLLRRFRGQPRRHGAPQVKHAAKHPCLRTTAEINAHTHASIKREVELTSHLQGLEPGHIVEIDSDRLGAAPLGQVVEHRIAGEPNQLTSALTVTSYLALKRLVRPCLID
jgi:hypothetical protein